MRRLTMAVALTALVGCSSPEFAPDATVSSSNGGEIAVQSWEFCGPTEFAYECLDSLPGDDLPVLTIPSDGSWTIDRPTGYTWEIRYRVGEHGNSTLVMSVETQTGSRVDAIPEPGRYLVEMGGRTEDAVGAWTFEIVIEG